MSKLEDTMNMPDFEDEDVVNIQIPDDASLDDITRLALEAYKQQMENVQHVEPKYRPKYMEVAYNYLNLAKDSLARKEELSQKERKLQADIEKVTGREGAGSSGSTNDRNDFLKKLDERKRQEKKAS